MAPIFTGQLVRVTSRNQEAEKVRFEANVVYEASEMDQLALAYAITTHRAQGSEFPVVVMPLTIQHYVMLQRNLLYTAITRPRELMVLVGSRQALARAVGNQDVRRRHAALATRLHEVSQTR